MKLALLFCILSALGVPDERADNIAHAVLHYSRGNHLDPLLVTAVIVKESNLVPNLVSRTQDYGLMQIHCPYERYAPWCKHRHTLLRIGDNVRAGTGILARKRRSCRETCGPHPRHHWVQHYNWHSEGYSRRILEAHSKLREYRDVCQRTQ